MKNTNQRFLLTVALVATVASLPQSLRADGPVTRRGTSVMHYMIRANLAPTNDESNVLGTLRLQQNEQGRSSKQSLDLRLADLESNTTFDLTAIVGDETSPVTVGTFETDGDGRARLSFKSKGQGHGGKNPVPEGLTPLTDIRAIGIGDPNGSNVAFAWINAAESYQYLVKRNLTPEDPNGSATGSISLIAHPGKVNFRLLAGGLNPTNDYHLVLNSNIVATASSSDTGRLEIKTWPAESPGVLDLRELAVWDGANNVILKTALPR